MFPTITKGKQIHIGPFTTSELEIHDILMAWAAITIAFAIVLTGTNFFSISFLYGLALSAITVGLGFLLHELGHKVVAQHYGCFAEFRAFNQMLLLMIVMSFFGFVFAAPGAVMISGPMGVRRNGKISLAGPLVNLVLALIFLLNLLFVPVPLLKTLFLYGFIINTWLALFNMIPVWNFDGAKIWRWSKPTWVSMVVISLGLMAVQAMIR